MKKLSASDAKALFRAVDLGLVSKVAALCKKGSAEVEVWLGTGSSTPLFAAARGTSAEIASLVLAAGGDVHRRSKKRDLSVLHMVRDAAVAAVLIDGGADLAARDEVGRTPLHYVAAQGDDNDLPILELFIARGAKLDAKDADGETAYQCRGGTKAMRGLLEKHGARRLPTAKAPPEPPKAPRAPPPKKQLSPLPKPFVTAAQIPPRVVAALEKAKIEGLPPKALLGLVRPAIGIRIGKKQPLPPGSSKLGGQPDLPPGTKWPTHELDEDRFLPHLFQIQLADVAKLDVEGLLPKKGRLSFFGYEEDGDEGFRVMLDESAKKPTPLASPAGLPKLPELPLEFYSAWTLPHENVLDAYFDLSSDAKVAYLELAGKLSRLEPRASRTRLLGWSASEDETRLERTLLFQLDADMPAPAKLRAAFADRSDVFFTFTLAPKDLAAKKLGKAKGTLTL